MDTYNSWVIETQTACKYQKVHLCGWKNGIWVTEKPSPTGMLRAHLRNTNRTESSIAHKLQRLSSKLTAWGGSIHNLTFITYPSNRICPGSGKTQVCLNLRVFKSTSLMSQENAITIKVQSKMDLKGHSPPPIEGRPLYGKIRIIARIIEAGERTKESMKP